MTSSPVVPTIVARCPSHIGAAAFSAPAAVTAKYAARARPSRRMAAIRLGTGDILARRAASCSPGAPSVSPLASVRAVAASAETPGGIRGTPAVAVSMVLGSITSVQCGAALATTLFGRVGSEGAVFLRGAFGALILLAVAHRDVAKLRRSDLRDIVLFGITLAAMNACFYAAIERLPLGMAVTLEFVGPLAVVVFGLRRGPRL